VHLIGSTSEKIIKLVECAVLVVKGAVPANPQKIFLAHDFSTTSLKVFQAAKELATKFGSAVHIVKVIESFLEESIKIQNALEQFSSINEILEKGKKLAQVNMQEFVEDMKKAGVNCTGEVLISRKVNYANLLIEEARKFDADLIVMGTHGFSGVTKILLGSTAELIIKRS
jgi:nucleotide-binding universal stress UspA family protein